MGFCCLVLVYLLFVRRDSRYCTRHTNRSPYRIYNFISHSQAAVPCLCARATDKLAVSAVVQSESVASRFAARRRGAPPAAAR